MTPSRSITRRPPLAALAFVLALAGGAASFAQTPASTPPPATQPTPPPDSTPTPAPAPTPAPTPVPQPAAPAPEPQTATGTEGATASGPAPGGPKEGLLPRLDVFFPEGDLDLRVSRLINQVFFEGQVKYNFIKGDINAFLRYRYYGLKRVTQFTVFDSVEFSDLQQFSSDFNRVRGSLLLLEWPHNYHFRTYALGELDRISSNRKDFSFIDQPDQTFVREGTTNTFVRLSWQVGTPSDTRSNALVGESRAKSPQLFTAFRDIGPGGAGFTGALTYSFDWGIGDYYYIKAEFETLKRFDVSHRTFAIGRVTGGSVLDTKDARFEGGRIPSSILDRLTLPRGEYFRLDGRDRLKGLSQDKPGTDLLLTTWEYYFPWFLDAHHDFLRLEWQNWYWILYSGIGNAGFTHDIYTDFGSYIPDVGVGFESSFRLSKYRFFLSGIVAQALKGNGGVEARFSIKSYR